MSTAFFASEDKLHDHRSVSRREKDLAEDLCQQIRALGTMEGFPADDRYRRLVKRADNLHSFLSRLSDTMDLFEESVRETAAKTKKILGEAVDQEKSSLRVKIDLD